MLNTSDVAVSIALPLTPLSEYERFDASGKRRLPDL